MVAAGVSFGAGRFAKHIVAVGVTAGFQILGADHRGINRLAQNKGAAHFLHRAGDSATDHRFAQTAQRGAQVAHNARLALFQHLAGQHKRPS